MLRTLVKAVGQAKLFSTRNNAHRFIIRNRQIWLAVALAWAGFAFTACEEAPAPKGPVCGDGILEQGEACEPGQAASGPCVDAGFPSGIAVCGYDCKYDTTFCTDGTCDNLIDDFGRGVDCDDPACLGRMGCRHESCTDGSDNDGDGLSDCMDIADCSDKVPNCKVGCYFNERQHLDGCSDGVDADCDGLVDDEDPECDHPVGLMLAFFPMSMRSYSRYPAMFENYEPREGAWGLISITFLAERGDLHATEIHWPVPEELTEVYPQDRSSLITNDRTVIWNVEPLNQGESVTVHAMVRINPHMIDDAFEFCMRAELNTDPPIYTTHPDPSVMRDGLMCVQSWYSGHGL